MSLRGGARPNTGRKPKWRLGKTTAIRIPLEVADKLEALAKDIDNGVLGEKIFTILDPQWRQEIYYTIKKLDILIEDPLIDSELRDFYQKISNLLDCFSEET